MRFQKLGTLAERSRQATGHTRHTTRAHTERADARSWRSTLADKEMNSQLNTSRWKKRLVVSVAVAIGFILLFPATVSDSPFDLESLVVILVPVVWGLYALLTYSDPKERIVGWLAFGLTFVSTWFAFEGFLPFAFMMDAEPLVLPAIVCLIAYWIVIRSAPHLPPPWGRRIMIGYVALHLGSWGIMHRLVAIPFSEAVQAMHKQAISNIPLEIARYRSWEPKPDPKYIQDLQKRISKAPRCSVWSVSPIPFVLVTTENYQIGPLWGLGMLRVYIWRLTSLKCLFEGRVWIS